MSGAQSANPTSATMLPASEPHAKATAPIPAAARAIVTAVFTRKLATSTTVRRNCWNSRFSLPIGTQAMPSMTTVRQSSRSISVASGDPSRRATAGAVTKSTR